jgi:Big-like domain-containing protein
MRTFLAGALLLALALVLPGTALAHGGVRAGQPFPTNLDTVRDHSQATGRHVDLAKPSDCVAFRSDCEDVDVLNQLDGFNIQPRISVPFDGPIDLSTVSSSSIFLVGPCGDFVGINQIVWEPAANTLHFESDEQLVEATTYLLVVTNRVRGADGKRLDTSTFRRSLDQKTKDKHLRAYNDDLDDALFMARAGHAKRDDIAAASLFTTQSIRAISRKIRRQLHKTDASFLLGTAGERTVFPLSSVSSITWRRQVTTAPAFTTGAIVLPLLAGVGTVAFGSYASPDYENASKVIPPVGTRTGRPHAQGTNTLQFSLFLPAGTEPQGGWPTAIFGHGFTDWKNGAPPAVAGTLARNGIATIAVNVVGHGGGPLGTYTVNRTAGQAAVTLPNGGRGIDQDGNGSIDSTEGVNAAPPYTLIGNRDGLRQTTIDLMQLVRVLEGGVDVDGDGTSDLSRKRIFYAGQSFGGIYGTQLVGLERKIDAGVLNVAGGPIIEIARLSPSFRILVGLSLLQRVPPLYNAIPNAGLNNFHENIPLRNLPTVTATPDETAIQKVIDRTEWAQQAANPAAYSPYIRRPAIFQFARGDQTVPNPTTSAILRACDCADRATLFRNDLAFAANPTISKNPHTFLTNLGSPAGAPFALAAQQQIATFFTSDGTNTVDPDGAGPFFETPTSMVPEDLAYIP